MKQLRKRFIWILCAAACLFSLTACAGGGGENSAGVDPVSSQALIQQAAGLLQSIVSMPDQALDQLVEQDPGSAISAGIENYRSVRGDLGPLLEIAEGGSVNLVDDGYEITVPVRFEQRACDFVVIVDEQLTDVVSVSFNPEYTLAENMTKAALNTVMGMGTVFIVLIFISILIGCFKYINVFEAKIKAKSVPAPAPAPVPAPVPVPAAEEEEEDLTDDPELAAVIAAAVAAASEQEADGLVVRSIRRVPGSKWKNS